MKRAVLPLAVALAICLPGEAQAGISTHKGKLENTSHGKVAFELKRKASGARKILNWRWTNLPMTCAEGPRQSTGEFRFSMKVDPKRSFYGRGLYRQDPESSAEVDGEFSPDTWKESSGTFRVTGDTSQGTNCESGEIDWTASRR